MDDTRGGRLSQGAVDGFWILLVFGLLFFNPFSLGSAGSRVNLSLYDLFLPLVFCFEVVRGRIRWPGRKAALLFLLPVLAVLVHSALIGVFRADAYLTPLLIGTLRQAAFFLDVGMLALLFQRPERRRPSRSVLLALLFMATAYALMMRYMEAHNLDWATYETIYAATITGLLLVFLYLQASKEKGRDYLRAVVTIAWVLAALLLLFTKLFILISVLLAGLFFLSEFRNFKKRRWLLFLVGGLAVLTAFFVMVLLEMNLGLYFAAIYGNFPSEVAKSIGIRLQLWSAAWQLVLESFPWGTGLNQFNGFITQGSNAAKIHLTSIHNTPLRLLTELGALGIGIFATVLAFLVLGGKKRNGYWKAMLCLYVLVPMFFHDALGLRALHVVLAFFLAAAFFQEKTPSPGRELPR